MESPARYSGIFSSAIILLLCALVLACGAEDQAASAELSEEPAPPIAAPLAKPHKKLGVEMSHLHLQRSSSLVKQARQRGLLVKDGRLLVQLAYEGSEEYLQSTLAEREIPVIQRFPRFQRLDVGLRTYADLDTLIKLGSIYRIEALRAPVVRTEAE